MTSLRRYALYFSPRPGTALARLGNGWLGYDAETGEDCARPELSGVSPDLLEDISGRAAHYGFHGTLKAPFFLAKPYTCEALGDAVRALAATLAPVSLGPLRLGRIDGFFALTADTGDVALASFAQACVERLDRFRAPPDNTERARRLLAGLTEHQQDLLEQWGYPYVADEFRFHLTLTRRLDDETAAIIRPELARLAEPCLEERLAIEDLCIFGEPEGAGRFRLLHRLPLKGSVDGAG